jgi:hypothetical protein
VLDFTLLATNTTVEEKIKHIPLQDLALIIQRDWGYSKGNWSGKGYYVNGKLSKNIYREDCFFDGPDPDMPVCGLRKYLLSASQLFDSKLSRADVIAPVKYCDVQKTVQVKWRIEGILKLPWKPHLKPWTGSTTYFLDDDRLVYKHIENWDITVIDAFLSTLLPLLNYGALPAPPPSSQLDGSVVAEKLCSFHCSHIPQI